MIVVMILVLRLISITFQRTGLSWSTSKTMSSIQLWLFTTVFSLKKKISKAPDNESGKEHYLKEDSMLVAPVANPLEGSQMSSASPSTASSNPVVHLASRMIIIIIWLSVPVPTSATKESQETARMSR